MLLTALVALGKNVAMLWIAAGGVVLNIAANGNAGRVVTSVIEGQTVIEVMHESTTQMGRILVGRTSCVPSIKNQIPARNFERPRFYDDVIVLQLDIGAHADLLMVVECFPNVMWQMLGKVRFDLPQEEQSTVRAT